MKTYNLQNNKFTIFPTLPKGAQSIALGQNKLSTFTKEQINTPETIIQLHLQNNQFTTLPRDIKFLINLQHLNLNSNHIHSLTPEIGQLKRLSQLHLYQNKLKTLPPEIGELSSLVTLDLRNNDLERLPESILNLKNLQKLYLSGNKKLPLPPNFQDGKTAPIEAIQYILNHQLPPEPSLKTDKVAFFRNISSNKDILQEYKTQVDKILTSEYNLKIQNINSVEDLSEETPIVVILAPFDSQENSNLIFDIIETCEQNEAIKYYILIPQQEAVSGNLINLKNAAIAEKTHKKLREKYSSQINYFSSVKDDFTTIVVDALTYHTPVIKITNLQLENIGHFQKIDLNFNEKTTCIVGENGTGKTTLLRALALGLAGTNNSVIDKNILQNLIRITGVSDSKLLFQNSGKITITYSVDGDECSQEISIEEEEGNIQFKTSGDNNILLNNFEFKVLVLGFPQIRSEKEDSSTSNRFKNRTHPNINDLVALIHNQDDERLKSFGQWIVNLHGQGNQKLVNDKSLEIHEVDEFILIDKIFNIISQLTKHEISFLSVEQFTPPRIIIKTIDQPIGIPLDMVSQGFKTLIGWIGHFLKRLAEANPLNKNNFEEEKAIVIIDEVDSYIHPIWQANFVHTLEEIFPNTQFILSTHSPLMIAGLARDQIIELEFEEGNGNVVALERQVDTWAMSYRDILLKLFNTPEPRPVKTIEELEERLQTIDENDKDRRVEITDQIERLKESQAYEDELEQYRLSLEEREEELETLKNKLKAKLKALK